MTTKITIPATIEEAMSSLNGLGALLTAKEWERAAIVRAYVRKLTPQEKAAYMHKSAKEVADTRMTTVEFARLGVAGLSSRKAVTFYADAWDSSGLPAPRPGQAVELPDAPFLAYETGEKAKYELVAVRRTLAKPEGRAELIKTLITDHADEVRAAMPVVHPDRVEQAPVRAIREPVPIEELEAHPAEHFPPLVGDSPPSVKARISIGTSLKFFVERLEEIDLEAAFEDDVDDGFGSIETYLERATVLLAAIQNHRRERRKAAFTVHSGKEA